MKAKAALMLISAIRRDGGTQIRAALDEATVSDYAAVLEAKGTLPDVRVMFDGADHWAVDGFHRIEAALRTGAKRIMAAVERGTRRDAILAACGANATHGLRRSNADKRRAVEVLLADPEWSKWKDREIARAACVSHTLVAEVRESIHTQRSETGNVATLNRVNDQPKERRPVLSPEPDQHDENAGGEEGAGVGSAQTTPAPDEPDVCVDMHGLSASIGWVRDVNALAAAVDAFDAHLRQAQSVLSVWVGTVQALKQGAHELAAMGRKAYRPKSVCLYCKDPDGEDGRREGCNGCRGLGWLTEEQLIAMPRELVSSDKVIDQKAGGFVARGPVVDGGRSAVKPHSFVNCGCGNRSCAYCNNGLCLACGKGEPARFHVPLQEPSDPGNPILSAADNFNRRALKIELVDEAGESQVFDGEDEVGGGW